MAIARGKREEGQDMIQDHELTLPPRRSSRLSLAGLTKGRQQRPSITRSKYNTSGEDAQAGELTSDVDDSSFTSSASPSMSPCTGMTSLSSAITSTSILTSDKRQPRKSSLKDSLGQEWTTSSRHRYWPTEGWTSATSMDSLVEGRSITKGSARVEWKGLAWTTNDKEGDATDDSPTEEVSRQKDNTGIRTRSGRVIKTVERAYPGGILKKRTRSDPLPSKRRATTPPSMSHLGISKPDRPQSAMKHRSANQYSLGSKEDSMIVVTSHCQMPEADSSSSPGQSPFVVASDSIEKMHQLIKTTEEQEEKDDLDAFSPLHPRIKVQLARYTLKARQSLPQSSFYERHKEEEGSPTPESKQKDSTSVS